MKKYYPKIEPYNTGFLQVDDIHQIYYEESGNPLGKAVVFLHGGPGFGASPRDRRFFNPDKYRIIIFDQRGCGRSKPLGELENNTTQHILADIEQLREELKLDKWVVFGGSWGSSLALAYSQEYPDKVEALLIRSVFTLQNWEFDWYFKEGINRIYPDYWKSLVEKLNSEDDILNDLAEIILGDNRAAAERVLPPFDAIFMATCDVNLDKEVKENHDINDFVYHSYRVFFHYFSNHGFLERDALLKNAVKLEKIPVIMIHGRGDMVCPLGGAYDLKQVLPHSKLEILSEVGHTAHHEKMVDAIIKETDKLVS
ncbi:MAG: prolyl aminopeptidase [Candidatus Pacebacteria bacterium]|nr:prolyl aminopeptidase [Candidatus Paceibacterota bacterium]MBT3511870.1 prolyl aminopeptidase [Candidatus Paceibacterota bacterium]MBT4005357.1 prolyl aminopeptidase [Candidatus Paceibacterota bacterium]MBT4359276.1 prolyl aminopeptidase [Candidatus Paceibacterota bacterium]MBT4680889.1 prolyl aminopeptidase [Candidatus Paceibacterota bacterium]